MTVEGYPLDEANLMQDVSLNDLADLSGNTQILVDFIAAGYAAGDEIDGTHGPFFRASLFDQQNGAPVTVLIWGVSRLFLDVPLKVHPDAVLGNSFATIGILKFNLPEAFRAYSLVITYRGNTQEEDRKSNPTTIQVLRLV